MTDRDFDSNEYGRGIKKQRIFVISLFFLTGIYMLFVLTDGFSDGSEEITCDPVTNFECEQDPNRIIVKLLLFFEQDFSYTFPIL